MFVSNIIRKTIDSNLNKHLGPFDTILMTKNLLPDSFTRFLYQILLPDSFNHERIWNGMTREIHFLPFYVKIKK